MFFLPLDHDKQIVLPWFENLLKDNMLLICISAMNPTKSSIVFFLDKHTSNPKVLIGMALIVKTVFFLPKINTAFCLFKNSESANWNGIILWNLNIFSFSFILFSFLRFLFQSLRRVDWTIDWILILVKWKNKYGVEGISNLPYFHTNGLVGLDIIIPNR
jgi:hypothetical protein